MPACARQPRFSPFSGYALRQLVVAPDLHTLHGPLHGQRQLPLHLDASARPFYDFASARDRAQAYQLVLLEATETADLEQWLQHAEFLRLWPDLYLPADGARCLAGRAPGLGQDRRRPHVPQL